MFFSVVVPTFGRPDEVGELLESLANQKNRSFEIILADGSLDNTVKDVADRFKKRLDLKHIYKRKLGISESRNLGVQNAKGDIIVFFDSDCVIPPQYFLAVEQSLKNNPLDAFGGPDRADESFNNMQKAISYAMTSFFTTGGIRGKKSHVGKYQPRSFNMGIRREIFEQLGGFSGLKVSEDIDLSIRIARAGYKTGLIEEAFVYHKRRSTFYKFFRQVLSFGSGRIDLQVRHGDALKLVHMLPSAFVIYLITGIVTAFLPGNLILIWLAAFVFYFGAIITDSYRINRNISVAVLSAYASFIMLLGYGLGMLKALIMRMLLKSTKESEKPEITKEA